MAFVKEIDNITLDILTTRFKNVVSQLDILKWLQNFQESENHLALDILSNLTVFSLEDIEDILNSSFEDLIKKTSQDEQLIVLPLGRFGKSGSMISYFLQKTGKTKQNRIHLLSNLNYIDNIQEPYSLVIVDDFIGTGSSFISFFEKEISSFKDKFNEIHFIGIAGMEFGVSKIKKYATVHIPKSNIYRKAFSSEASYFGYRNYKEHREFSYKYGAKLVSSKERESDLDKTLGFGNSQALVSFFYGTPNNTLPIIWANKNGWIPLIPRFSRDRISKSKKMRKLILYELSILKEIGSQQLKETFFSFSIKKGKKHFSSVNKVDFSVYSVISLLRKNYTPVSICHILGILHKDYEEVISRCVKMGIMDEDRIFTSFGLDLYYDAKKCIEQRKKYAQFESENYYKLRKTNYLPKIFNGKS